MGNINGFFEYAEGFFEKNKTLKHSEMELEMLMISGFIYNLCQNLDTAREFYDSSLRVSNKINK